MVPAGLDDDAGAEDQSHEEDGVPQLLQILLQTHNFGVKTPSRGGRDTTRSTAASPCS